MFICVLIWSSPIKWEDTAIVTITTILNNCSYVIVAMKFSCFLKSYYFLQEGGSTPTQQYHLTGYVLCANLGFVDLTAVNHTSQCKTIIQETSP